MSARKVFDDQADLLETPQNGIRTKRNLEEKHPFILNIFYCFFLPFVCRVKPITDDDIYEVQSDDRCDITTQKASQGWQPSYSQYLIEKAQYDQLMSENPDAQLKPPARPSLLKVLLFSLGNWKLLLAIFFMVISIGFQVCQPSLMKEVIKAVMIKSHLRSGLAGIIYKKTLLLNITSQSNIDTGRLLSLLSTDTNQIAMMFPMFFQMAVLPIQIFVPFGFICYEWGWSGLTSIGALILTFPFQAMVLPMLLKAMKGYLAHNDIRNKVTNETLQGMRVVKLSGLENVFQQRVEDTREVQLNDIFYLTLSMQLLMAIMNTTPQVVNISTMAVYIATHDVPQLMFPVLVMPTMGYLSMMTMPLQMMTMIVQAVSMVMLSIGRILDFLILPELKVEAQVAPDNQQIAVEFDSCSFVWGDPPEIPLEAREKEAIMKETQKRKKQMLKETANKKDLEMKQQKTQNSIINQQDINIINNNNSNSETNPIDLLPPITHINHSPSSSPSPSPYSSPSYSPSLTPSPTPTPFEIDINGKKVKVPTLHDISFKLPKGSLTMVIGAVGSGKSSVGAALIGDIEKQNGTIRVNGSIAYCPQAAWINNNTVRGNITFGNEYNEDKYNKVVHVCALESDFQTLAAGDMTAIGEKGVNLSGGQKARIQLARAVYSDRDIYILDDPLSAVDAHVGRFLLEECIEGRLKGKTRLLMTNQLQFIDRADNIILLNKGRIAAQGTSKELKEQGIDFDEFIIKSSNKNKKSKHHHHQDKQQKNEDNKDKEIEKKVEKETEAAKQIMTEEEQETGSVPWSSYLKYILSLVPAPLVIPFLFITLISQGISVYQSWWMGTIGEPNQYSKISYHWKIGIYAFLCLGGLIFLIIRAIVSAFAVKRSNRVIHQELLSNVMNAPSSFFDTTPMGRILNRFTGDITITDQTLYMLWILVVSMWIMLVGQIVIIAIDTVWFLIIGGPALLLFFLLMLLYGRAARNLQRLEAISRSPVLSHFGETITGAGLSTIRAYHLENDWQKKFEKLNDRWSVRFVIFNEGKKWATLWSSIISTIVMAGVVIIGWNSMSASKLAVAITASLTFANIGVMIVQMQVDMQSRMTSYDRIRFYSTNLPQEVKRSSENPADPPKDWPKSGRIQFDNVTFRYRSGLPYVLKGVSFDLRGGEKIGVCGRTGAGKSSLLFALFRLVELDPKLQPKMIDLSTGFLVENDQTEEPNKGRVLIDEIDISKVDLSMVRRSIAIIPQDPTLFTGTLRYNLDIGGKYTNDDRLWEVLGMVEMRDVIAGLPLGLDTQVAEGGSNFSAGQRQLVCFGRAILNNCRIVVMDEATASVDVETDAKIQKTIKEQFVDKTVFVIAHRLNTIMNSDRIMVMDDGNVAEIDTPDNLKNNPDSSFNGLIRSLD
ncbi:MAG: ABC transporter: Multidrug resistance-associated protein, ATP binding protein [Streblomastix strix]|uniref:ABC transporter: Multidrug resistance-associated protein, ATP binding protein n=1 Tax=Streblomastix strix TaxID=222440 RepID=A0A5J4VL43_9EUKA|nr:MAG: ABC transporter: Multidrug resistance-associated protein, ATP binding protein [Streblomastix strix]